MLIFQAFAILVVLNSATLFIPWNVEEEENSYYALLFMTGLSAVANILFTVEVPLSAQRFKILCIFSVKNGSIDATVC